VLFGGLFVLVITLYPAGFVGLVRAGVLRATRHLARRVVPVPASEGPVVPAREGEASPVEVAAIEAAARTGVDRPASVPSVEASARDGGVYAVECRDIVFSYIRGVPVLDGVDFAVRKGTIHGLIGPNGSGKSTLVDLIAGRQRPAGGTIALDGRLVERGGPPERARHGFMRTFQAAVLVRELPARDNVAIGFYSRVPRIPLRAPVWPVVPSARRDGRLIRAKAREALAFVGAEPWADVRIGDVPHGVEQLTQLAAACVPGPSTIILDEPLAGLSPTEVEHVATILSELKSAGVSVILIEHQPRFVFALCDEVTVLDAGKVVAAGAATEVRANERVREVYLGQ